MNLLSYFSKIYCHSPLRMSRKGQRWPSPKTCLIIFVLWVGQTTVRSPLGSLLSSMSLSSVSSTLIYVRAQWVSSFVYFFHIQELDIQQRFRFNIRLIQIFRWPDSVVSVLWDGGAMIFEPPRAEVDWRKITFMRLFKSYQKLKWIVAYCSSMQWILYLFQFNCHYSLQYMYTFIRYFYDLKCKIIIIEVEASDPRKTTIMA